MSEINYVPPQTAFLALRPSEMIHLSEAPYDQDACYVVMLHETPAFPGVNHVESKNLTVICAGWYNTETGESGDEKRWGWVHLEADTKEIVGHALQHIDATPGTWYYMLISGGLGNRPRDHFTIGAVSDEIA